MGNIAVWLAALVPSLVGRILAALGMGVVSVVGFDLAWNSLKAIILSNFQGMPAAMAGLAGLAGIGEGLGIILGAITARMTYQAIMSSAKIAGLA